MILTTMFRRPMAAGLLVLVLAPAAAAQAGGVSRASEQSAQAVSSAIAAGTAVVGYSVAIPLIAVSELGEAVGVVGSEIAGMAETVTPRPLPVSDQAVTAGPRPDAAMAR